MLHRSLVSSCCTCTAKCWYKQEEQDEDNQEHNCPLCVTAKNTVHDMT